MNERKDFSKIPAAACTLVVGEFELGDNGEGAKTAPVRLVARSGKPIEHWFWGRVVHDLAGMHLHKSRIPIDYVHDSKEVIGYLNRFDTESGDLVTSGALVPFKESDRATEIVHKMRAGVPYEASINFGGDGLRVQELGGDETAEVNGARFDGPGIIVREWPLRGVAICPYGADMNTSSAELAGGKTFAASVVLAEPTAKTEDAMSKPVEVAAQAVAPKAEEVKKEEVVKSEAVEAKQAEAAPVEAVKPVVEAAAPAVEAVPVKAEEKQVKVLSREEYISISDKFGAEIADKVMREGGDYVVAMGLALDAEREENKRLRSEVEKMAVGGNGTPVKVVAAPKDGKKAGLFKTGK